MPLCDQCKKWTQGELLRGICEPCVIGFLNRPSQSTSSAGPSTHVPPTQPILTNPFTAISRQPKAFLPSHQPISKNPIRASLFLSKSSPRPLHAGANAYSRHLAKEAQMGKSKDPSKPPAKKTIESSLFLYQDGTLWEKKGLFCCKQTAVLTDPSLYENLCYQLWEVFSEEIIKQTEIKSLPYFPRDSLSLCQGISRIPSQTVLQNITQETTSRKKLVIDLMYHHSDSSDPQPPLTSSKIRTASKSSKRVLTSESPPPMKRRNTQPEGSVAKSGQQQWALGGKFASKPATQQTNLTSHLGRLSQRVQSSSTGGPSATWILGQRLCFFTTHPPPNSDPQSTRFQLSNGIQGITFPINYKVHLNQVVGSGGMRTAYAAEVKTEVADGIEHINHWVAKIRLDEVEPSIDQHATDALMYEGFSHLLAQFKLEISHCEYLRSKLKNKGSSIQASDFNLLVRHAVVANGPINSPTNVYFLEAFLDGPYVKYSSNDNFAVPNNQPGMDLDLFKLMNAFTHWTYNNSMGKHLVSDLQGVGSTLTDPQIIDMDPHSWSDGNTSSDGIAQFLKDHICHPGNEVCEALQLGKAVDLKWAKPQGSLADLVRTRNAA
ncbi:Eukaryotic elongation factor-2 kinase [Puccinia graminis f. sp. tritici]|uniref:Eukaryotic elongation factor-2 kinase n=1 Tax=Puccinia graminis f. sp. tritici TaxID=56615 RepID=A0A5B0NH83_PUCGR|nr:Eukaryotic elongation factor-2 kinase [Puccinia graminis f. sp. tritici]